MRFDRLKRVEKKENFSKWQGQKGTYIFRHLHYEASNHEHLPVAQIYLDRKYLSGVFRTQKPFEFSGDLLDSNGKKRTFIKLILKSAETMEIEIVENENHVSKC